MIDTISSLRAYALKHARALRILRSVKAQGSADAYQDMGHRLSELEKHNDEREKLVQEVIRLARKTLVLSDNGSEDCTRVIEAARKLAEFRP